MERSRQDPTPGAQVAIWRRTAQTHTHRQNFGSKDPSERLTNHLSLLCILMSGYLGPDLKSQKKKKDS